MAILQYQSAYQQDVKPLTLSDEEKATVHKAFTQNPSVLQLLSIERLVLYRQFDGDRFNCG